MKLKLPRHVLVFGLLTLIGTVLITRTVTRPTYTDAYYYYNAAVRLVNGDGLTDTYLWTYIGAPETLGADGTFPSHIYWMPFTSLVAAAGMWLAGSSVSYTAAQWPFTLLYFGVVCTGFWLGGYIGKTARHAWVAGLLTLFSGFFVRFWGETDAFAPYGFFGALALVWMGLGAQRLTDGTKDSRVWLWWFLAGVFSGIGHLTRADGLLLLVVAWLVVGWPWSKGEFRFWHRVAAALIVLFGYALVMLPWMLRNLDAVGAPLPVGGTQAIWFTSYDELVNYPPDASPSTFFADGIGAAVDSRWTAIVNNFGTFIAVEGLVMMAPLMLVGLWCRRRDSFLRGFALYALGLHLAMTLVFPFPGYRGGLFHSAAALVPWWAALGVVGLDDVVEAVARRRRRWKPATAKWMFSVALVILAAALSFNALREDTNDIPAAYAALVETLPEGARVMVTDPAALYYFTGYGGVVMPNEDPAIIPEIASAYEISHLLIMLQGDALGVPNRFDFDPENPPGFLTPIAFDHGWLYAVEAE